MSLRFNFHYPNTTGSELDLLRAGDVGEVAAVAERCGFHGFSFSDHPIPTNSWLNAGGHQTLDPFVALAFAAATTEHLRLITHLLVGPYRQPFVLAKSAATLDRLSNGRLTLGLGVGYLTNEYEALGVDYASRNVLFDELLDVLPLHWSGEPFSYSGTGFDAADVIALPTPTQNPIPIWIGGNSPLSRRRAATRAQGWMPMIGGPAVSAMARTSTIADLDAAATQIAAMREAAEAAGRSVTIDVMVPYFADAAVLSEPVRHLEALAAVEAAGVTWVTVSTASVDLATTTTFLEGFGSLYIDAGSVSST